MSYLKPEGYFLFAGRISASHAPGGFAFFNAVGFVLGVGVRAIRPTVLGGIPRRCGFLSGKVDLKSLQKLSKLVETGEVKGIVDSVWEMEDLIKGYERQKSARAKGKVVIHVQD